MVPAHCGALRLMLCHVLAWILNIEARAGAAVDRKRWRGNKHKQHALSCLQVSRVPADPSQKPRKVFRWGPLPAEYSAISSRASRGALGHAVINGKRAARGA